MIFVDIGNTNIQFATAANGIIAKTQRLGTATATADAIKKIISKYSNQPLIISSVVPTAAKLFSGLPNKVYFADKNLKVPIKCNYNRSMVGADRLVCAYAAKILYPETRVIIDLGTATTIDFLSAKKEYDGGFILPGLGSTMKVLTNCAMLPKKINHLTSFKNSVPKNTQESINRGISEGFALMLNSFVDKYKKLLRINPKSPVIITGGDASTIKDLLNFPAIYDSTLVFKGLLIASRKLH